MRRNSASAAGCYYAATERMSDELLMTQEFIANMLGGRRESVTVAAGHLQREKPLFWRATPDDDEHYVYAISL